MTTVEERSIIEDLIPVQRLSRDIAAAAATLSDREARFLVDTYYAMQEWRKRAGNQIRSLDALEEPHAVITWQKEQSEVLESQIGRALARYADGQKLGVWMQSVVGIGPVISAGLLANLDFTVAKTASAVWRFAGLDPTTVWGKGEKRPWNASLKRLAWIVGDSFVKFSNHPFQTYGSLYRARKEVEIRKNEAGEFAETAERTLATRQIKDPATRATYTEGKLPAGRIDLRARRVATKMFLAHVFEVGFFLEHGYLAPIPWIMAHDPTLHTRRMLPPNMGLIEGLAEAEKARMDEERRGG